MISSVLFYFVLQVSLSFLLSLTPTVVRFRKPLLGVLFSITRHVLALPIDSVYKSNAYPKPVVID